LEHTRNNSDVKYSDKAQNDLTGNRYDVNKLFEAFCSVTRPQVISHAELSRLIRDLNVSGNQSKFFTSKFKI
jgi:hypothetical protein